MWHETRANGLMVLLLVLLAAVNVFAEVHKTSASALAAAQSALSTLTSNVEQVKKMDKRIGELKDKIETLTNEKTSLERNKDKYMDEIRRGEYCSGCGLTRSEILAKGEQFPHPGRHIVHPTEAQIKAKEHEYDNKVIAKGQEIAIQQGELNRLESQRLSVVDNIKNSIGQWRTEMQDAGRLLTSEWQEKQKALEDAFSRKRKTFDTLNQMAQRARDSGVLHSPNSKTPTELPQSTKDLISSLNASKEMLRGELGSLLRDMEHMEFQYRLDYAEWSKKVMDGRGAVQGAIGTMGVYAGPSAWQAPDLNLSAGSWSLSVGQDKLGIGFGSSMKMGIQFNNDWLYGTQSLSAGLEADGIGGLGMKRTTTWGQAGVVTEEKAYMRNDLMKTLEGIYPPVPR